MADRVGTAERMKNEEDGRTLSELTDDIRDAIIDYQVSRTFNRVSSVPDSWETGLDSTPAGHV